MLYVILPLFLSLYAVQEKPQEAVIAALIDELGSGNIKEREEATQRLKAMGRTAMPQLENTSKSTDSEIAFRAQSILRYLRAWTITDKARFSTGDDSYERVLSIKVSEFEKNYKVGKTIPVTVHITNHGPKPGSEGKHPTAQLFPVLTMWVEVDGKTQSVQIKLPIKNRLLIKKGAAFTHTVDLSNVSLLKKAGRYTVSLGQFSFVSTDLGDWTGVLRSREQRINIRQR